VKSAILSQKYFSIIFSIWVSKNAEFDADFESVEKVAKKSKQNKTGMRTVEHST
jgi:hypothetical protein